jgi:hypothetical protein
MFSSLPPTAENINLDAPPHTVHWSPPLDPLPPPSPRGSVTGVWRSGESNSEGEEEEGGEEEGGEEEEEEDEEKEEEKEEEVVTAAT